LPIGRSFRLVSAALLLAPALACSPAAAEPAQQDSGVQVGQQQTRAQPGQAKDVDAPAQPAAPAGDAALKQRVEQLEEQLVDMQVVVGTLESLARAGTPASSTPRNDGGGSDAVDNLRVDALETQVRALAAQIEQLAAQVRTLSGQPRRADAGGEQAMPPDAPVEPGKTDASRFGSTTVTAGTEDAISGVIEGEGPKNGAPPSDVVAAAPPPAAPQLPGSADGDNPKQLFETAFGYLMQRDYGAAQAAFEDFLNRYPKDSLAGNAQYWLGESHFVRGEYKAAAASYLKAYKNYGKTARASDSLLKLAMSLDRLGQKDAACSSYSELNTRFPEAPDSVKTRAKSERQRIGCP